ncbi:MAG: transcription termination factor Rho, partial [Puniceicoccales bacterium]|nr:transcription termination factor Rho [Puniceicoccales bacterium]
MEKFTPPVSAPPPSPPPITTDSVAAEVAAAPPIVVEESGKIVPPPSAPTAPTAPSAQQSYSGGKQHPDQRRFQSNGNGGGQGKQHSHGNNPQTAPAQQSQHQHNNNNNNQRKNGPPQQHQSGNPNHNQGSGKKDKFRNKNQQPKHWPGLASGESVDERTLALGTAFDYETLNAVGALDELIAEAVALTGEPFIFNDSYALPVNELVAIGKTLGYRWQRLPPRRVMVADLLAAAYDQGRPIHIRGTLELLEDGNGLLVYLFDNYRVRELSAFVPRVLIKQYGLLRGHELDALALPAHEGETAPVVVRIDKVMGEDPEIVAGWTPFTELTPYYPTKRMLLETDNNVTWDNLSMRCVDLLCPVGLGQRGLIVAPPRTGKTVLLQGIANSIVQNTPAAHLIILLVDERPEEVTDFRRQVKQAEIVSSTFDESAESHVHAAEMVIERARRMVEAGRHVVILLDSITRLARAYNTMMPSTGKILSGGVESNALSKPKRFFGSARNIEGGGSLTILGTALVDTGSKMDEVIFE